MLFPKIGVAAASLSISQQETILRDRTVRMVRNEPRSIPSRADAEIHALSSGPGRILSSGPGRILSSGPGRILSSGPGRILSSGPGRILSSGPGRILSSGPGRILSSGPDGALPDLLAYFEGVSDAAALAIARLLPCHTATESKTEPPEYGSHVESLRQIGVTERYPLSGKGVPIAVLDTGLDLKHPDFRGRVARSRCYNFLKNDGDVADGHGHGTHCCGIIAGPLQPKNVPRYAIAPDADLWVGKVLDDDGIGFDSEILAGIAWAIQMGVKIISLSLGSAREAGGAAAAAYETLARKLFTDHQCLLVAAAGNDSNRSMGHTGAASNPAACDSFLGVAAIDPMGTVADFSSAQRDAIGLINVCAPGVNIFSSWKDGRYARISGTSAAAPCAAAVAALFSQAFPDASVSRLWDLLEENALPLGSPADYGRGCVRVPEV